MVTSDPVWAPADLPEDLADAPTVMLVIEVLRSAGYEICELVEDQSCLVHPGEPSACYFCS